MQWHHEESEKGFLFSLLQYWMNERKYPHFRELIKYLISLKDNDLQVVTFSKLLEQLNKFISIKPQTFSYHLEKLVKSGILIKIKRDSYQISPLASFYSTVFEWIDRAEKIGSILARSELEQVPNQLINALLTESVWIHHRQAVLFDHIRERIATARRELKVLAPSTYFAVHPPFKETIEHLLQERVDCSVILSRQPGADEEGINNELKKKGLRIFVRPYLHDNDNVASSDFSERKIRIPTMMFIIIDNSLASFSFLEKNYEVPCDYIFETKSSKIIRMLCNLFQDIVFGRLTAK